MIHTLSCPTCTLALYFGFSSGILHACTHTILNYTPLTKEFVYSQPSGGYLLYTPNRVWTQSCQPNTTISHKGLFVVKLQCQCSLKSHHTQIHSDALDCHTSNSTIEYSVNFLVFTKLYNHTMPRNFTASLYTTEQYNFHLPKALHDKIKMTTLNLDDDDAQVLHCLDTDG